jgi:flagellar hook-associated protein 2
MSTTTSTSVNRISGMVSGLDTDSLVKKMMSAESVHMNTMKQQQQKLTWQSSGYRQWNTDIFSLRSTTLFNMKLEGSYSTFAATSSNPDSLNGTPTADAIEGTYSYEVSNLAQSATITSNVTIDTTQALANTPTTLTLTSNDQTGTAHTAIVSVAAGDKIGDVVNKINAAKDASGNSVGLKAIYDSTLKQFILRTKDTGASTKVSISADNAAFLSSTLNVSTTQGSGIDAKIKFNGSDLTSATNNIKIMGVNYTLKNVTTSAQTVNISRDVDTEVKNIKDFVTNYNTMLDKLNTAINEPVYNDYQPLTDDQRTTMSDTQVVQWETKAKSGLFHNDSTLQGLVNNMRNHITSKVDNGSTYNSLSSIGIASTSYIDKGKLTIDETKLRAAIQADPDAVKNLFSQSPTNATDGQKGVVVRLYDDFQEAFTKLGDKAGATGNAQNDQSTIGKLLSQTNTEITNEQTRLDTKQTQYYAQFTAMETALSKYQSQSSWLTQQLSGSGGG